jgi:metallo-beta-lactamase class B
VAGQAQNEQHVFGAKTAQPYTEDDYLYGRTFVYNTAEFRKTPNGPNTPGSAAYKSAIEPFRIAGDTYYVGVAGQGSYLITTKDGDILIEQPYDQAVGEKILSSIKALGFDPKDIKILTASEYHFDHMGATSFIKKETGAQLMVMEGDAELVEKGEGIPAVKVDRVLHDRDQIKLGDVVITAYHIPGHTPGATTFLWQVTERNQKYNMAEVCCWSNMPPSHNLVSDPLYPTSLLRHDFEVLKSLPVDIPTPGAHSDHFNLQGKLARMKANPKVNPWIAPQDYRGVIAFWDWAFEEEVLRQLKEGTPAPPARGQGLGAGSGGASTAGSGPRPPASFPPFPDHP